MEPPGVITSFVHPLVI